MNNEPLVCVIIVTWNNANDIRECLSSILNQDYSQFKVLVIDNASTDNTTRIVQEEFSAVELIKFPKNIYLTGGNNYGIHHCIKNYNPEYMMILNADTKSDSNLISVLVNKLEQNSKAGAAGPKVKFWNNKNEGKINSAGLIYDGFDQAYDRGFMEDDIGQFDSDAKVFGVTGAGILYRVAMLNQIGLYWEQIKLHLDEVELFIRAQKKGWEVIYTADTTLHHKYMQSTDQNKLYKIDQAKKKVWLWIALRHYPIKSKIAMIRKFLGK